MKHRVLQLEHEGKHPDTHTYTQTHTLSNAHKSMSKELNLFMEKTKAGEDVGVKWQFPTISIRLTLFQSFKGTVYILVLGDVII